MPRKQTVEERIKGAIEGPSRQVTYLIPHFSDEGQDNGFFESEKAQLVEVSVADLEYLLANQKSNVSDD